LTDRLYRPANLIPGAKGLWWSKWSAGDTPAMRNVQREVTKLLKKRPDVVAQFGTLYYATDDDTYWQWWEFAVFDGNRWETFHVDKNFDMSLEAGSIDDSQSERRQRVAETILAELRSLSDSLAASQPPGSPRKAGEH
jgi:hypothetical protein